MRSYTSLLVLFVAGAATVLACSSSSSNASEGCASSPFSCAGGQTCAVKDSSGTFACLTSGAAKKGEPCVNTPGMTTCGDNLVCLQTTAAGGQCASFCESGSTTHACATGEQCRAAALAGTSNIFYVCAGGAPADAGASDAAHD